MNDHSTQAGRTVVLGGGPAGLTAAYLLTKVGRNVTVLEAEDQIGGLAKTVERDGYRFDLGGQGQGVGARPGWRDAGMHHQPAGVEDGHALLAQPVDEGGAVGGAEDVVHRVALVGAAHAVSKTLATVRTVAVNRQRLVGFRIVLLLEIVL